ncbi:VOC family protein [Nocardia sp. NPDC048505]|uniref:VOC family protein n=1 Tax=unclassified Nocardia TaxID=2637762 RepID=UPI0033D53AB4
MEIAIYQSYLPQTDPDAAVAFYRDVLGFELRNDVGYNGLRWLTVGPPGQPEIGLVLYPPTGDPGITPEEHRVIGEMMAKGTFASINLGTKDLDAVYEKLRAAGAEVVQEPTDQDYGVRDCAFRDPSGNMIRIKQAD